MKQSHVTSNKCHAVRIESGFTLIELVIVIAIIGTLTGLAAPAYLNYVERSRRTVAITDLKTIEKEIYGYYAESDSLPVDLGVIGLDTYADPWGNPYRYLRVEDAKTGSLRKDHFMVPVNTDYDLYSMGPDGESKAPFTAKASRDDIVRARNGQFIGPVSAF